MKTLVIERVANGWIIRPFSPGLSDWAVQDQPCIYVYRTIKEIVEALPELLAEFKIDEGAK